MKRRGHGRGLVLLVAVSSLFTVASPHAVHANHRSTIYHVRGPGTILHGWETEIEEIRKTQLWEQATYVVDWWQLAWIDQYGNALKVVVRDDGRYQASTDLPQYAIYHSDYACFSGVDGGSVVINECMRFGDLLHIIGD